MSLLLEEMDDIDKLLDEADQFYRKNESLSSPSQMLHSKSISNQTKKLDDDVSRYMKMQIKFKFGIIYDG